MHGLGTVINVVLIIIGATLGLIFRTGMKENLKNTLMKVSGIIVLLLGISGALQYMLTIVNGTIQTTGPMMMIIVMVMASSMGKGALFSFISVGVTQAIITLLANVAQPFVTDPL